nr:type IV conjugative transfer system protein TraE [Zoogloeaceae bacterium]
MDANRYSDDLDALRAALKRQQYVSLALVLLLLLMAWNALNQFGRERTIVTPPALERSFWITANTASTEYIEQMALWAASMILDVTPNNAEFKSNLLLQFADPGAHGALQERATLEIARLKRDNSSTLFDVETIRAAPEKLAAVITGKLNTYINGVRVSNTERHYLVRFRMSSGRAAIIEFSEAPHADLNILLKDR